MKALKGIFKAIKFILATAFFVYLFMFIPIAYKNADPFYRMVEEPGYAQLIIPVVLIAFPAYLIICAVINKFIKNRAWLIKAPLLIILIGSIVFTYQNGLLKNKVKVPDFLYKYKTTDFFGLQPYSIETSSMEGDKKDNFSKGDLVFFFVIKEDESLVPGTVYSYSVGDPLKRVIITHRYLGTNEEGLCIFKGDANAGNDLLPVNRSNVLAKFLIKIPKFGVVLSFIYAVRYYVVYAFIWYFIIKYVMSAFDEEPLPDEENYDAGDYNNTNYPAENDESNDSVFSFEDDKYSRNIDDLD